jgi:hypothetical protein
LTVDVGPKIVGLWAGLEEEVEAGRGELFEWFTTDKLIHDRSRGLDGVLGFDKVRDFADLRTALLLYPEAQDSRPVVRRRSSCPAGDLVQRVAAPAWAPRH